MAAPTLYIAVALVMTSAPADFKIETLSHKPFSSPKQCKGFLDGYAMRDVFEMVKEWVTVGDMYPEKEKAVISYLYEPPFEGYIIEHKHFTFTYDDGDRVLEYVDKNDGGSLSRKKGHPEVTTVLGM